ncbi:lectin C-type domain protein [Aspergillus sclerotioniger CBS 115572]|uniref:Maintenance of telomere capping protein 6 n=1 Tax=Aspergillus sclerotioniger CBS 115572 TaxID=1450535 RepID=A0A317WTC7_9EURO|nr:lectin C-type domain protein [Aspergillus sclerotioniger CBS 115572]PWY89589.1 lectin C-type domain protein [Aspergillus sclerotioniger CBS 115572]
MSLSFSSDVSLNATEAAVFLSERDVAGQIPINFVTTSAVSLHAACFGDNVFDRTSAGTCISNLLVIGYRRFLVDVYWSPDQRDWLLCPVSLSEDTPVVTVSSVSTASSTSSATATATTNSAQATVTAVASSSGSVLYELGPYRCSKNLDLSDLINVFREFFQTYNSEMTVYTRYISLNLHAAASATSPTEPASPVTGSQLPTGSEFISSLFDDRLSSYIYMPSELAYERADLNKSWYEVEDGYKPITEYFTIQEHPKKEQSTPDGWPCEKYLQLAKKKRLIIDYGTIDPQMKNYNQSYMSDVIFPPGYLTSTVSVSLDADGSIDTGCFYNPDATTVSQVNNSWAMSDYIPVPAGLSQNSTLAAMTTVVTNLTACGLTPALNNTLFNKTADNDLQPYDEISLSTSWAWAIGEPADAGSSDDNSYASVDRCAAMDLTKNGQWSAINCTKVRYAACRVGNLPFTWQLSTSPYTFRESYDHGCPENTSMAIPRTGLENTYLYQYLLTRTDVLDPTSTIENKTQVLLDLNSIDVESCWVTGGPDHGCPYASDPQQLERRTVLVAAIAGIVICIIAALTLFVKCNANRRNSRRNKRVIKGWEYEGVPS